MELDRQLRATAGFYVGDLCPLCEKGRLVEKRGSTATVSCEACGAEVRRAQLGDYPEDLLGDVVRRGRPQN